MNNGAVLDSFMGLSALTADCVSRMAWRTISRGGSPSLRPFTKYVRHIIPYSRTARAACSTSRPFTRMLGEPRKLTSCAFAVSATFTSDTSAEIPSSFNTSCTRSNAGLWFGHPSKYRTSILMIRISRSPRCVAHRFLAPIT